MYSKDVGLFRNGLVHKFYCLKALFILEQVNTSMFYEQNVSKTSMVRPTGRCCKLSLYANESCDEQAIFLVVIEMRCHVHHIFALW